MKAPQLIPFARKLALVALALNLLSIGLAGDKKASSAPVSAKPEIPRSAFDASMPDGKDPFFPASTRRNQAVEMPKTQTVAPTDLTKAIKLKGISGTLDQRLAIINNRTFAVGESDEIQVGKDRVHVLLKEIRQESVIVVINKSHWKELKLREGV